MSNPLPVPSLGGALNPLLLSMQNTSAGPKTVLYHQTQNFCQWCPVALQVLDPYRITDLIIELTIVSFVQREMYLDLQTGLRIKRAACAFLQLASTSSSLLPVMMTRLLRYVEAVTCSRSSSPHNFFVMSTVFARDQIATLDAFTLRPTLAACY